MKEKMIDEKIIQLQNVISENTASKKRSFKKHMSYWGNSDNFFDKIGEQGEQFYNFYKDSLALIASPFTGEKSMFSRFLSAVVSIPLGMLGLLFITATVLAPLLLALEGIMFLGKKLTASSNIKYANKKIKKLENMKKEKRSTENRSLPTLELGKGENNINIKTKENEKNKQEVNKID